MKSNKPIVLIMCGGQSLRLWPLSEYKSKNFLDIFGFSPLEMTLKRFSKITSKENIFLVANKSEKKELERIKLIDKKNIILEPQSKNTAAAIYLSLLNLRKKFSDQRVVIISPIDHLIKQEKIYLSALKQAVVAASDGSIITLGIQPDKPTVNLGYIQIGNKSKTGAFAVKRFVEKPSLSKATTLIKAGNTFFNSGVFISSLGTLEEECKKYYCDYGIFNKNFKKVSIVTIYRKLTSIPFDKAVMEKTKKAMLVKAKFSWKDFGNWKAIHEVLPKDSKGNSAAKQILACVGKNNFIHLDNPKKKVIVMGIDDIVFVDTADYCLISNQASLDDLKALLKRVKSR